ncbi:hypothetical protein GCM10027049_10790 [Mucilaginibacter puniceus]
MNHTFHIPVLGLAFSIDTPLKVARYGISSVVSVVDDILIERMRKFHTEKNREAFIPIDQKEPDFRARRITAYLNLMEKIVDSQFTSLKQEPFEPGSDITRYFELLPETASLKVTYNQMLEVPDETRKQKMQNELRWAMQKGAINVNIMSKVDKLNLNEDGGPLGDQFSDALSALRGFAQSNLRTSLILSAGMNPRLYSYLETFEDFFPDSDQKIKKNVILKVSDFRSAFIQAKFLAKKGIWVSEFRIESGLNCGGHAFATEGYLLGPILEEFKQKREEMIQELFQLYQSGLEAKGLSIINKPAMRISVQGGIGTGKENSFLLNYYGMDATGWGSPFLLVPEATNVDEETLQNLVNAKKEEFYLSNASPLGIPFNNFRNSSSEKLRLERIVKGRPGSPCKKKYLVSNTEFTSMPICTASREYQKKKIDQLKSYNLQEADYQTRFDEITEKACLCEGLTTSVYQKNNMLQVKENKAVAICPGPNTAYFSGIFSLDELIKHIYGKFNLLSGIERPNMFINELNLYIDYLKKDVENHFKDLSDKKAKYFLNFKNQLQNGIAYYKELIPRLNDQTEVYLNKMYQQLAEAEIKLQSLNFAEAI